MDLGVNVYFNTLSGLDEENMVSIYIYYISQNEMKALYTTRYRGVQAGAQFSFQFLRVPIL
jgi:hypothetical protein